MAGKHELRAGDLVRIVYYDPPPVVEVLRLFDGDAVVLDPHCRGPGPVLVSPGLLELIERAEDLFSDGAGI